MRKGYLSFIAIISVILSIIFRNSDLLIGVIAIGFVSDFISGKVNLNLKSKSIYTKLIEAIILNLIIIISINNWVADNFLYDYIIISFSLIVAVSIFLNDFLKDN